MNGITWLASYPKSGNTWLRAFLTNLRAGAGSPADINALHAVQFSTRELFDRTCGWKSSELLPEEIAGLRIPMQRALAEQRPDALIKTHENFAGHAGRPRFAAEATRVALYVVRNPLDIAISLSHHWNRGIDSAVAFLNNPSARLIFPPGEPEFDQPLGDWSAHVRSWVEAPGLPICVLRYEDLEAEPGATFARAAAAAGCEVSEDVIQRAVWHSRFEELQRQEAAKGFGERLVDRPFFRSGRSGGWRQALAPAQISAIVAAHGDLMRRFGYLRDDGAPL